MQPNKARADLWMDLGLVAFLIAFDVAARLLPHAPGVWPFAASALFAGRVLRLPLLAIVVPVAAVLLSNVALAGEDWRVTAVVCAAALGPASAVRSGALGRGTGSVAVVGPARLFLGVRSAVPLERKRDARVTDVPIVARLNYAS